MIISVRYFALLKEQSKKDSEDIATSLTNVAKLYAYLQYKYHFTLKSELIKVAVNGQFEKMDYKLKEGDEVAFIPPVAGG